MPGLAVAALASIGAGAVHAAATGVHAEHPQLARLFVICAAAQIGCGLWALLRPSKIAAWSVVAVNALAVGGWLTTRLVGISWIEGLEVREAVQFADSGCAALGAAAAGAALVGLVVGWRPLPMNRLALPSVAVLALAVPAMWTGGTHVHSGNHTDSEVAATDDHGHDTTVDNSTGDTVHTDDSTHTTDTTAAGDSDELAAWPRPWDPAIGIDLSGVPGVSAEQQTRAQGIIESTLLELPRWADTADAFADGYRSIGDAGTGTEHYIRTDLIGDDTLLDPTAPESLVYNVVGDQRILAGAMYIASPRPTDDPSLTDWAGALMTWHNHGNLCWDLVNGAPTVVGLVDAAGKCARGVNTGGESPMVHVWILPHPCGPFAALEGVGAGQASVPNEERVDMCDAHHSG